VRKPDLVIVEIGNLIIVTGVLIMDAGDSGEG
jgi:hypothetical protein